MIWPFKRTKSEGLIAAEAALAEANEREARVAARVAEMRVLRDLNHFGEAIYQSMVPDSRKGSAT